jgi:hypothetical protein
MRGFTFSDSKDKEKDKKSKRDKTTEEVLKKEGLLNNRQEKERIIVKHDEALSTDIWNITKTIFVIFLIIMVVLFIFYGELIMELIRDSIDSIFENLGQTTYFKYNMVI